MLSLLVLRFEAPFRFGWRKALEYIDSSSIARALIRISTHLGVSKEILDAISTDNLRLSSLLPLLPLNSSIRILAPFPLIPRAKKARLNLITLNYLRNILTFVSKCIASNGEPVLLREDGRFIIRCIDVAGLEMEVSYVQTQDGRAIAIENADAVKDEVKRIRLFEYVVEYHNRLDRVSYAADLFTAEGVKPFVPMWIAIQTDNSEILDIVKKLFVVLQDLGLGGKRRFGWGRYTIDEDATKLLDRDDLEALKILAQYRGRGLYLVLGRYSPGDDVDLGRSFYTIALSEGFADHHNVKPLPRTYLLEIGSLLYAEQGLRSVMIYGDRDEVTGYSLCLPLAPLTCGVST